jgi:hypothetical protein
MRQIKPEAKTWNVIVTAATAANIDYPEPRKGDAVLIHGSGRTPLVVQVTEVHEESDTILAEFYK